MRHGEALRIDRVRVWLRGTTVVVFKPVSSTRPQAPLGDAGISELCARLSRTVEDGTVWHRQALGRLASARGACSAPGKQDPASPRRCSGRRGEVQRRVARNATVCDESSTGMISGEPVRRHLRAQSESGHLNRLCRIRHIEHHQRMGGRNRSAASRLWLKNRKRHLPRKTYQNR